MNDHVLRMRIEAGELGDRTAKLQAFLKTAVFLGLAEIDQGLLQAQLGAMAAYLQILIIRIERSEGQANEGG